MSGELGPVERKAGRVHGLEKPWSNFPLDFSPAWSKNSWWTESLHIFPVLKTVLTKYLNFQAAWCWASWQCGEDKSFQSQPVASSRTGEHHVTKSHWCHQTISHWLWWALVSHGSLSEMLALAALTMSLYHLLILLCLLLTLPEWMQTPLDMIEPLGLGTRGTKDS